MGLISLILFMDDVLGLVDEDAWDEMTSLVTCVPVDRPSSPCPHHLVLCGTRKLHELYLMMAIDFQVFQAELDAAFHQRGDPIPSGSPEHEEFLSFIVKLHAHRMHKQIKSTMETQPTTQAESKLGIPMDYDPRFRMNSSFVIDKNRMATCIRGIERKLQSQEGSGHGWTTKAIIDEYKAMLPVYHDFCNNKKLKQLKKIGEDRKALPISSFEDAIVDAMRTNRAVVVAGSTGCGKSTQVPQFLIKAGYNRVACTQPRRISAIALARRVSHETLQAHGSQIAYKIRFSGSMTSASKITFMTEGILLRMLASDPSLKSFDVVVIDEVHERHLNTDFLLALLRAVMIQRPDLHLVLMSATINFSAYSDYFGGAPVIQVPGRLYPITLEYIKHEEEREKDRDRTKGRPLRESFQESINPAPYLKLLKRIDGELPSSQRGDMLIFVAGTQDIDTLYSALRPYTLETKAWLVLKLHASLSVDDQDKVFDKAPEGVRKCIISTNIAETSVTIDGIRFVVDSGRAKEMIATDGIASLQEGWISKASADQRKGRAGRTGPGRCYRMYSEKDFERFRAFNIPEIQRIR
jgi:HrpA-like RNA helicase